MFVSPRSLVGRLRLNARTRKDDAERPGALQTIESESISSCVVCDSPMTLIEDLGEADLGVEGMRRHKLHCATCGMLAERLFHPYVGYPAIPVPLHAGASGVRRD